MSVEAPRAFIEKMKTDEDFAKKVTECRDAKAWMTLAKEIGLDVMVDDITVADMEEAIKKLNVD
ncbi:MAG: Nif11 domain [Firmicutes bacterium]|nr:Nif11 domain [Bacillota bacterium]